MSTAKGVEEAREDIGRMKVRSIYLKEEVGKEVGSKSVSKDEKNKSIYP